MLYPIFFNSLLKAIKCAGMFLHTDSNISSLYTWLHKLGSSIVNFVGL